MTKEFVQFLNKLPRRSKAIWLEAMSKINSKGVVNIIYKDLMREHHMSKTELKKLFCPKIDENKVLVKVLVSEEEFISLHFKMQRKAAAKKKASASTVHSPPTTDISTANTTAMVPANFMPAHYSGNMLMPPGGIVPEAFQNENCNNFYEGVLPENYKPSFPLLRAVIWDYCQFYKHIIVNRAALLGNHIAKPMNPKIQPYDVKAFRELATYFGMSGCNREVTVRQMFRHIYNHWHRLPHNYQDWITPAQINRNINGIYAELTRISNKPKNKNRKDAELTERIEQNQPEDFSHMVAP